MNNAILIRSESPSDAKAIEAVTTAAFLNAPHTAHTEQFIVAALRRAGALAISLVAEQKGELIGHVAASPAVLSDGSTGWYGLGPISVLPSHQRTGIGSALMRQVLERLRDSGAAGCALVGDPNYYSRFGFRPEPKLVYPGIPPEYFMVVVFNASIPTANVFFHDAFNARA